MVETIEISQLFDYPEIPLIDVRTPAEFSIGHIPGAVNIPLFNDNERAEVGTRFHNAGKEAGFLLGVEFVGPKLSSFIKKVNSLYPLHCPLILYCWRGGLRSNAMAWLFNHAGHNTMVINGGYKAFRSFIREQISNRWNFFIVGGMTGAGKTDTLKHLKSKGKQVIDLEAIANHRGSVFGHLGQNVQPSNEEFEIMLWDELRKLDPNLPVFLEDESRSIGKVSIPEPFYIKMQLSILFLLEVNTNVRVERLVKEYGCYTSGELTECINRLGKYLGGDILKKSIEAITENDLKKAVELILPYYDKKYRESISKAPDRFIVPIEKCTDDGEHNALLLIQKSTIPESSSL